MGSEYENYGKRAEGDSDPTRAVGRYYCQRLAERLIVQDVVEKLQIKPTDRLLEIGCGVGTLLIPLAFLVEDIWGVDHPAMLERLTKRCSFENGRLIAGDFLELDKSCFDGRSFEKILIYSVLHCLPDEESYFRFMENAINLLAPGGRILFGDLPNIDRKRRFSESESGKRFENEWNSLRALEPEGPDVPVEYSEGSVIVNDSLILSTLEFLRSRGLDAYIEPQDSALPFGNTREDIWASKQR